MTGEVILRSAGRNSLHFGSQGGTLDSVQSILPELAAALRSGSRFGGDNSFFDDGGVTRYFSGNFTTHITFYVNRRNAIKDWVEMDELTDLYLQDSLEIVIQLLQRYRQFIW